MSPSPLFLRLQSSSLLYVSVSFSAVPLCNVTPPNTFSKTCTYAKLVTCTFSCTLSDTYLRRAQPKRTCYYKDNKHTFNCMCTSMLLQVEDTYWYVTKCAYVLRLPKGDRRSALDATHPCSAPRTGSPPSSCSYAHSPRVMPRRSAARRERSDKPSPTRCNLLSGSFVFTGALA